MTVDNDVCTLTGVTLTCRPVQRPNPPIWVAANSDAPSGGWRGSATPGS